MEKKNENKAQSLVEIYASSQAANNRSAVNKEINSQPRPSYAHVFEKSDEERGEFLTERNKWRKQIQAEGFGKRNHPLKTYVKLS